MVTIDELSIKMATFYEEYDPYGFGDACNINGTTEEQIAYVAEEIKNSFGSRAYRKGCYEFHRDIIDEAAMEVAEATNEKDRAYSQQIFDRVADIIMDLIEYERRYA